MTKVYSAAARSAAVIAVLAGLCAGFAVRCGANSIMEFPIPSIGAAPEGITFGPDGAYWFVEYGTGYIGRITTNGVINEYIVPTPGTEPFGIAPGPDGNLWFTESAVNLHQVGRITTNGIVTEYALPFPVTGTGITAGPDGRMWLLDFGGNYIPGQTTNGGVVAFTINGTNGITNAVYYNVNMTVHSRPVSITTNPDGNLYFTEQLSGRIGCITTNGVITEAVLNPTNVQPEKIITGPDGALWFTQFASNALGRMDLGLNISEFNLPTNNSAGTIADQPNGLALGKDGNLYYTDPPSGIIGRATISGTNLIVTQFYTPTTNAFPELIATGADGNLWFGEVVDDFFGVTHNIGELLMPVPLTFQFTNSNFVLSWTTNFTTNFVLEGNPNLNPTNWFILTNVPVIVTNPPATNGVFQVTLPATNGPLFFRLID